MTAEKAAPNQFPELRVSLPSLELRPFQDGDAADVAKACNDEQIQRWLPLPSPYTLDVAVDWCTRLSHELRVQGDGLPLAIITQRGEFVGSVSLKKTDWRAKVTEIGYWTAPWMRSAGYASAATAYLARWALDAGIERVELVAAAGNRASQRVAEKAGFQFEGVMRNAGFTHHGRVDLCLYALTADPAAAPPSRRRCPGSMTEMLAEFHAKYSPVSGPPSAALVQARRAYMTEEQQEYQDAEDVRDLVKIADGLADIVYIAYGTALCYGIDLDAVLAEVHASNMTKDAPLTPGGKAIKGPGYRKPDLARLLETRRWRLEVVAEE